MFFQIDYMKALFDDNEYVCITPEVTGVASKVWSSYFVDSVDSYICINPLISTRCDAHVEKYRNILVEFDNISLTQQRQLIDTMPYTTVVFSGNKSYHTIISLEQPLQTRVEYDALVKRIYDKLPQCDKSVKNPSRLTRMGGGINTSTGRPQTIEIIKLRVSMQQLESWLGPEPKKPEKVITRTEERRLPNKFVRQFLLDGAPAGERNRASFANACELLRCGYEEDEIIDMIAQAVDLEMKELTALVRSAARTIRRG